jgi:FkbM family methyltransferase
MGVNSQKVGSPAVLTDFIAVRFTKWVSRRLPDVLLYRILVRRANLDNHALFQAGISAADPRKIALDIGANRGTFTWHLAQKFPQVHAFEPNQELGEFLSKVIPRNCTLHRCALSETSGQDELALAVEAGVPIHGRGRILNATEVAKARPEDFAVQKISLETLDDQNLSGIGFIKIDVEGHEEKVLRGGLVTLRREKPVLIIEIEKRHTGKPVAETHRLIESLGYRGYFFEGTQQRPLSEFEESMQEPRKGTYINDFLFLPQ